MNLQTMLSKISRLIPRFAEFPRRRYLELVSSSSSSKYVRGSARWLISTEREFGGMHTGVPRITVSPIDPRSSEELMVGGMTGGDRMGRHGYAVDYARHLNRFLTHQEPTVVECGVLRGSGLALWSKLFPSATLIGLDIDLSHASESMSSLRKLGAFTATDPLLLIFDQFRPDVRELENILAGKKINIFIDDGFHSNESILRTYLAVSHLLSNDFVYFIEDNRTAGSILRKLVTRAEVSRHGLLTVVDSTR